MGTASKRFNTALDTYFKTREKLQKIDQARVKQKQDQTIFEEDRKIKEAELNKARYEGKMTENDYEVQSAGLAVWKKQNKGILDGKKHLIDKEEHEKTQIASGAKKEMIHLAGTEPEVKQQVRQQIQQSQQRGLGDYKERILDPVSSGGHVRFKERKQVQPTASEKAIGSLANGGFTDNKGAVTNFTDREEAEKFANSKLGIGWKRKYPQAVQTLDKKYGPSVEDFPESITTKKQAYDYLINDLGMDDEGARNWIEENN